MLIRQLLLHILHFIAPRDVGGDTPGFPRREGSHRVFHASLITPDDHGASTARNYVERGSATHAAAPPDYNELLTFEPIGHHSVPSRADP
ncbi:hypothetical protein GCM10009608_76900 [Pseudonocardia alaniniphila]